MFWRRNAESQHTEEVSSEEEQIDQLEILLELPREVFELDSGWHRNHRELERLLKGRE
jgi:hypothetical protein